MTLPVMAEAQVCCMGSQCTGKQDETGCTALGGIVRDIYIYIIPSHWKYLVISPFHFESWINLRSRTVFSEV